MAKSQGQVTKIYQLKTLGYDEIHKQLQQIGKDYEVIKKAKRDAETGVAGAKSADELAKFRAELAKIKLEEAELKKQRQEMINQAKAEQLARQAAIREEKEKKGALDAVAGSYNAIYKEYRELYNLMKSTPTGSDVTFRGQLLTFDQAIAKLKQLAAAEQDFRRQFQRDGLLVGEYTSGIIQAFKKMGLGDLVGGQITKAQQRINELDKSFEELKREMSSTGVNGAGELEKIERQLIDNRKEAIEFRQQIERLENELRGTGDIGAQITAGLREGFKDARRQLTQFLLGYVGFQAILGGIQKSVQDNAVLSDKVVDLQRILGETEVATNGLVQSLEKIDTRTSLKGLVDISIIAAKAGVASRDIDGVTKSIDELQLVAGKELGDVEKATESIVKLVNIFGDGAPVTEDAVRSIGNGIVELANKGVASGGYLIDFAQRLAGIAKTANITMPSVFGLGAAFEELGQSSEVSSSAVIQIMSKIATDVPKYAKLAGKPIEEFTKTLRESPQEALLQLAEGLKGSKTNFDEISTSFAEAEAKGVRVTQVLGVLASNADFFREKIQIAGTALNNTNAIVDGARQKQETFAAQLDKITKKFEEIGTSKAVATTFSLIAAAVLGLLNMLPALLVLLGLLGVNYVIQNAQLILLRGSLLAYNVLLARNYVLIGILAPIQAAYNAVLFITNTAVGLVNSGLRLMGINLRATSGPLGIVLTLVSILGAALLGLSKAFATNIDNLSAHARQLRIARQVHDEASAAIADHKAKAEAYAAVVRDTTISEQTRLHAMQELIKLNPSFSKALQGNKIDLNALNTELKEYNSNLLKKAELEAATARQQKEFSELVRLQTIKQGLEIAKVQGKGFGDLGDDEQSAFSKIRTSVGRIAFTADLFNADISDSDFKTAFADLDALIKEQQANIDAATTVFKDKYAAVNGAIQDGADKTKGTTEAVAKAFEVDIAQLKARIKQLDDQIDGFQGSKADLTKILAERKKLNDQLQKLLGTDKPAGDKGSRLSGTERDALRDVDSARDELVAKEKLRRAQGELDEETYLKNVLKITQDAIDQKLKLIKGGDAAERKVLADLRLERVTSEQETNNKIFELRKAAMRIQLDNEIKDEEEKAKAVKDDPSASSTQRAQAKLDADRKILDLQIKFADALDKLEKALGQQSLKNAKEAADAVRKTKQDVLEDERELDKAALEDAKAAGARSLSEFRAIIARQRIAIMENEDMSPRRRERALTRLDREENIGVLAREVANMQAQLPKYKQLLAEKKISDEEYLKFIEELKKKQAELHEGLAKTTEDAANKISGLKDLISNGLKDLFNIEKGSAGDTLLGEALEQTWDLAQQAMNSYFDAQTTRIEDSRDEQLEQLELEKEKRLARATTRAEEEKIEKDFAAKKKEIDRKAGEELKKAKLQEAKISFAIELANIAAAAAANPANAASFGAAGAIQFAVLGALATGRYLLRVGEINRTKFEWGGQPGDVPTGGGKFGGKSHGNGGTPFQFKGQQYEAEVDELAVIRTKDAPRNKVFSVVGTQAQIASAMNVAGGGVNFAPGAKLKRFAYGGNMGESLQAPVFVPSSNTTVVASGTGITAEQFQEAIDKVVDLAVAQSDRIDRLEVVQVTSTVTNAQAKQAKQSEVGTL